MTINPICTNVAPAAVGPAGARPATEAAAKARTAAAADSVALSDTTAAVRALAASPPVDDAKVATLKAAIAAGTYALDPAATAEKMIALDLP